MAYEHFSLEEVLNFFLGKFSKFECSFSLVENNSEEAAEIPGLAGFKVVSENIWNKIDQLNKLGGNGMDFTSVLSPRNTGEVSTFFKIGRVDFMVKNPTIMGQLEFLSEMKGAVLFKQIAIATFRKDGKSMFEISNDWSQAAGLHGLSLLEFIQNPKEFMAKRF